MHRKFLNWIVSWLKQGVVSNALLLVYVGMLRRREVPASVEHLFEVEDISANVAVTDAAALPADLHYEEIMRGIMQNDVCIVFGETGSGFIKDKGWSMYIK